MSSAFLDKSIKPDSQMLSQTLGTTNNLWEKIKTSLILDYGELNEDWKFYGQKIGWTLKLLYKKRNLFFLTPHENYFQIAFVFGDKAVSVIEKNELPVSIINEIRSAKKYMEGRGLRIAVKKQIDVNLVLKLTEIKINN
ncbi:MAG: DUF3788 family protein [Ignavibacteria bacterium]|nr:DUF3788 family protein [Ignavibacteria bacterium]